MNDLNLTSLLPYAFLVIGIGVILYALFRKSPVESWLQKAEKSEGIIFEISSNGRNDSNSEDIVVVRFVTKELEWITAQYKNEFGLFYTGQYTIGEKVDVLYNPDAPQQFKLLTKQSESTVRIILTLIGFVFLVIGAYKLMVQE